MKIPHIILAILLLFGTSLYSQKVNPDNITIVRDEYGVPYIFSKTDKEAVYGIAWAQAEDNFHNMQETILAVKGLLAGDTGKDGAILDVIAHLVNVEKIVEEKFESTYSDEFKDLLDGYLQGINRYAELHPDELRHKDIFPLTAKDLVKGYVMSMTFISNVYFDMIRIFENELGPIEPVKVPGGSNGISISPKRSDNGKTFMISNSHQPLEGFTSWYELQVHSEEGWHFHGATFAGGMTPFVGTNENLGWTHCVNYDDFHDVYRLNMHPDKKLHYKFDGEWLKLEERPIKLKVKVGFLKIPVKKTFYWSKHGTVVKNKSGYYALRFPSNMVCGMAEQWYRMNKSSNKEEFVEALEMQELCSLNIIYADKEGNIMFVDNGLFPYRDPAYDWDKILPGDTSATLWPEKYHPVEDMLKVENPDCGYVFNMNNTGFDCTCPEENPEASDYDHVVSYQKGKTARSLRWHALIDEQGKVSYEDLKKMKFDGNFQFPLYTRNIKNFDEIRHLDEAAHPEISDIISIVKKWDGGTEVDNQQAAIISLSIQYILKYLQKEQILDQNNVLPNIEFVHALRFAKKHLQKHFGRLEIPLGDLQKHVRGDKEFPIWGLPEAITAMYTSPHKKGTFKSAMGESFILFSTYGKDGVEKVETINCFGSSNNEESPHFDDQMEMYLDQKLKPISMDKEEIMKNAKRKYSPK